MENFDFWKIISTINWPQWLDWTVLIDASGLMLAVIGFLNLAEPIERYFRRLRDNASYAEKRMSETIKKVFPLHKNWWRLFVEGLRWLIWPVMPALVVALFLTGEHQSLWQWFRATPPPILVLIAVATPFLIFLWITVARIFANRLVKYVYWIIWLIVSVLAYPPAGVLGSIGLIIAFSSLVLNRLG